MQAIGQALSPDKQQECALHCALAPCVPCIVLKSSDGLERPEARSVTCCKQARERMVQHVQPTQCWVACLASPCSTEVTRGPEQQSLACSAVSLTHAGAWWQFKYSIPVLACLALSNSESSYPCYTAHVYCYLCVDQRLPSIWTVASYDVVSSCNTSDDIALYPHPPLLCCTQSHLCWFCMLC